MVDRDLVRRKLAQLSEYVASQVLSDRSLRPPSTYAETFEILVEAGALSPVLGRVKVEMTGFRNILVHEYEAEALGWV